MININNILPEEKTNELSDFEKIIMKWTAFDHYCPSIKAEVIWDMMLSEFIVDMVAYAYREEGGRKQYTADNFYLLAKEFPIKSEENDDTTLSCSKVDYLVAFEEDRNAEDKDEKVKKVILVELKTTPGSFRKKQLNLYRKCDAKKMFEFYDRLINEKEKMSKEPLAWDGSEKYTGQITYMFHQFSRFHKGTNVMKELSENNSRNTENDLEEGKFHSPFIKKLHDRYQDTELFYLYVKRVKDSKDSGCYLKVQMKDDKEDDGNNKEFVIYDSKKRESPEEFLKIIKGKSMQNDGDIEINKVAAWKTFCKLIDTVNNYKTDFEETKKEYEPYHRD